MNIFILDIDPVKAAEYQCNKHMVKMILESAQIMSTVHSLCGNSTTYKPTHPKHPCTIWARESVNNYKWLLAHAKALCSEYTFRYGKVHKTQAIIDNELSIIPNIPDIPLTKFVQAMPDKYKEEDPVEAYRAYYICEKGSFAQWKKRNPPNWWIQL